MKFSFNRNALINEISIAQETMSGKGSGGATANVTLVAESNLLTIRAGDSTNDFVAKIPVETEDGGTAVLNCSKLFSLLSLLPEGDIDFEVQQKDSLSVAVIKHSAKKIRYSIWLSSEQPSEGDFGGTDFFRIPAKVFKDMVQHTAFSVSTDEVKMFMNGVFFEKDGGSLNMVATDSKRLAYDSREVLSEANDFASVIVHPKMLNIVAKHASDEGDIEISVTDRTMAFRFSNYILSTRLIDGQFPNYRRVIPERQANYFVADKAEFQTAMKRISVMNDIKFGRILLDITPGVLSIHSESSDGDAREEIPCQYAGEDVTIAVRINHIDEALKSFRQSESFRFEFTETTRAITVRPEPADSFFDIVMPMQLG